MPPAAPTILCVDDEPLVLTTLREQFDLDLEGWEVEVAQDAAEALEILDRLQGEGALVPLVISDHIMPGMKGDEFLAEVRARFPTIGRILLRTCGRWCGTAPLARRR